MIDLFKKNRIRLFQKLPNNSIAIIYSNEICFGNADTILPYKQNNDLIYLTGILQPDTILLLYKDDNQNNEFLFIKKQTTKELLWEGEKLNKEKAKAISGIKNIYYIDEFQKISDKLFQNINTIYLNKTKIKEKLNISKDQKLLNEYQNKYPKYKFKDLQPIISKLRAIKEKEEIYNIKEACNITNEAFRKVLKQIKPNIMEYEIEAEFIYQFRKIGCKGFAYNPIVASGKNSCILHYEQNNAKLKDGDLILLDIGVNYNNYNSDITRTFPINGKFSQRQKVIYNSVLFIMKSAMGIIKPNLTFKEYNKKINSLIEEELLEIALITENDIKNQNPLEPAYRKYFMHGISHHLGLDVHDPIDYDIPMKEGMVITVEPGIYIKEENIGIRLETDILIKNNGIEDLGREIPIEIDEIEDLMDN
ncbi:MAG: aminopeptidase P family protein [Bacteroidetes bacterium]|nr:aminopeptidase P family protein [Bacteroidota bacterium]